MERIKELDYLKCVFIVFMVMFHLAFFADKYPYFKQIVYTFHMPAFLLISGFLSNPNKSFSSFSFKMFWIFVPYSLLEVGYVVMSSILPVRESIDHISVGVLLQKVFMYPMGPYWYIHTLLLCTICYYGVFKIKKINNISRLILLGLLLFFFSYVLEIIVFANAMYFILGVAIKLSKVPFMTLFRSSVLSIIPLFILCCSPENLDRTTLGGVAITYFVIVFLLFCYSYLSPKIKQIMLYVGRNTLVILLFSPIFTMLSKLFIPLFSFDPTAICFMIFALLLSITGSLSMAYIMDRSGVSSIFFGQKKILT